MNQSPLLIELRGLHKSFDGLIANSDINLRVRKGTVHAIVGENGAGKSTAMKMLYGMYRPDSGEILIDGLVKKWKSPADAILAGIGMVHQHFMLAGPYTAWENAVVGYEFLGRKSLIPKFLKSVDRKAAFEKLTEISNHYGFHIDWNEKVESLSVGVQQRLEIIKLLYRDAEILILDEPTAVLAPGETSELLSNLKALASRGKTILIITHKLKEVMNVADEVTVFRAGRSVVSKAVKDTSIEELASLMIGRRIVPKSQEVPVNFGKPIPVLEIEGLTIPSEKNKEKNLLSHVNLTVKSGEIIGIAGIEGNGQSTLLKMLLSPASFPTASGKIRILGKRSFEFRKAMDTRAIKALGVGFVPEDRLEEGLLLKSPIAESFLLGLEMRSRFSSSGLILRSELNRRLNEAFKNYNITPDAPSLPADCFSGGNQQKVIIAREFENKPKLLIAAQPTRGVDIGAIEFIHGKLKDARNSGCGILLISSELDEIFELSDRILVIFDGMIVAEFQRGEGTEEEIGFHMAGGRHKEAAQL